MAFTCLPYGVNMSHHIHDQLHQFYNRTGEGCCGCLETFGKWILVAPAHLLTAGIVIPALMIYDLALTTFFFLASLFTLFLIKELRDRFTGHFTSMFMAPFEMRWHQLTGLMIPCIYRGLEVIDRARDNHPAGNHRPLSDTMALNG